MSATTLTDADVVPIDHTAPGVSGLRILFVNVFGIRSNDGWVLVDAGLRGSAGRIRAWASEQFGDVPPSAIVLTHGHFDHVGALGALLEQWDVPVYAHPVELPHVNGTRSYPPPDPSVGGGLMARMSVLYPRGPFDLGNRTLALPPDGSVPGAPEWRWLHTPGHTAGHVSLFREQDRTLIVGDAFCTTKAESFLSVATQRPELHGPPAYFTTNWTAARASVERLAALRPAIVAPGHGAPMHGEHVTEALETLARRFDALARPQTAALPMRRPGAVISPGQHAVLDYAVAATFFVVAAALARRHRPASRLAALNGAMVLGMSLLTDYPGGVYRVLPFKGHRTGDIGQAALAGLGPMLMGFSGDREAAFFYSQALSEVGVIAATDWSGTGSRRVPINEVREDPELAAPEQPEAVAIH
jgi:glyoxylase-like metal-dependent hydrolase (beta-lactamase superfamily II)